VLATTNDRRPEIIVVDDGSTDATELQLEPYRDSIVFVSRTINGGFARACNDGAAAASGELLVFLNNDTIPFAGWLHELCEYARHHPTAAIVGAKLLYPSGLVQHAGVVIGQDKIPRHLYAGFPAQHPAVNRSRRFQIVTAACALVRREAFERLGGFDTAFVNGYEDVDLCLRAGQSGAEIHYCHTSALVHLESVTEGRWSELRANERLYDERWGSTVVPDDVAYYVEDGLLNVSYDALYPCTVSIAPELATVQSSQRIDQVLLARSRQTYALLKENINLKAAPYVAGTPLPAFNEQLLLQSVEPRTLPHRMVRTATPGRAVNADPQTTVSVVMPVKDAADDLSELIPLILAQDAEVALEIVAVDSGSSDETVDILRAHNATVVSIDPADFDHGLARNLGASFATGDFVVFLNKTSRPANENWLGALLAPLMEDGRVVGACSRVIPRSDADILSEKDGYRDLSASSERRRIEIGNPAAYATMSVHERRALLNFHTVSAAIRRETLQEIPFRAVPTIGEDLLWAKEVAEAGYVLVHEPESVVVHSHAYGYRELLERNVDDGVANLVVVGRRLPTSEVEPLIRALVQDDWSYLEERLSGSDVDRWRVTSVMRRTAQVIGQWIGANADGETAQLAAQLSRVRRTRVSKP
jgi:GT2 family glycosyltransferase